MSPILSFRLKHLGTFGRQPGFAIAASSTLAVGIALTTTAFSLIQGVLLRPPPYRAPDRLVTITSAGTSGNEVSPGCHADQWLRWRKEADLFDSISGYTWGLGCSQRSLAGC